MENPKLEEYQELMLKILKYFHAVIGSFMPFDIRNHHLEIRYRMWSSTTSEMDNLDKLQIHNIGTYEDYRFSPHVYEFTGIDSPSPSFAEVSKLLIDYFIKNQSELKTNNGISLKFPDNFYKLCIQMNLIGM